MNLQEKLYEREIRNLSADLLWYQRVVAVLFVLHAAVAIGVACAKAGWL